MLLRSRANLYFSLPHWHQQQRMFPTPNAVRGQAMLRLPRRGPDTDEEGVFCRAESPRGDKAAPQRGLGKDGA